MAAAEPLQTIKEEVTCPICLELFRDPVTSECGHSFCQECIARHCQGDGDVACPLCNEKLQKRHLRPNRELRNIVESLRSQRVEDPRGGNLCETHQQPLRFYCKDDQSPICVVCKRFWVHRNHTVVPVEEAVQEYWKTMKKQLVGIESTYRSLHPLVSRDWKHLPQNTREEMHRRLKRLADSTAILLKVDTEGPRQRFEALASQPQPREPDRRGRGRGVATRSELRECQGREPGSDPAAEKQEETRTHVVHVCEEAPTPKYGLDQATLDPAVHTIRSTRVFEKSKVAVKGQKSRFEQLLSPDLSMLRVGSWMDRVSPAGQGAAQTESGGDTGRGGRESQELEAAAAGVPTKAKPAPGPLKRQNTLPRSWKQQQADAPSRGDSPQGLTSAGAATGRGRSRQDGVSAVPVGRAARGCEDSPQPVLHTEEQGETETPVREEAAPPSPGAGKTQQDLRDASAVVADAPSRGDSFQSLVSPYAARECGGSGQDGVSPAGNVTQPPDLQGCAVEVTLDLATAQPRLVLSGDHKGMSYTDRRRNLPDHPKRFDVSACALGSQGFTSGRHYWEVEVVVGSHWAIGVTRDSANRKGNILLKPSFGFWALSSSELPKSLPEGPRKVGVYLDYEGGEVRFYNAETMALISSLTATFTGRVFPFFCLRSVGSYMKL